MQFLALVSLDVDVDRQGLEEDVCQYFDCEFDS